MKYFYNDFPSYSKFFTKNKSIKISCKISSKEEKRYLLFILTCTTFLFCFTFGYNLVLFKERFLYELLKFTILLFSYFLIVIPIHLILHTFMYKGGIFDKKTTVGFNVKSLVPFNTYNGMIKYNKFIFMTILPLVILTIIPLIIMSIIGFNTNIYALSCTNLIVSTSDIFDIFIILKFIPQNSYIIKSDNRLYYSNSTTYMLGNINENIKTKDNSNKLFEMESVNNMNDYDKKHINKNRKHKTNKSKKKRKKRKR